MSKKKGHYIEADLATIDGGKMLTAIDGELKRACKGLDDHLKNTDDIKKAKATVTVQIEISKDKHGEYAVVNYTALARLPKKANGTHVRIGGGLLLLDDDKKGDGLNDRDQMTMFDRQGNATHKVDKTTGEEVEITDVAGQIG